MLTNWLTSALNLLVFFRCTEIWLNVVLIALGVLSGWVIGLTVTCLSAVVAIFNITVCVLDHKAKRRTQALPPARISVICLDIFFALCYVAVFVLELLKVVIGFDLDLDLDYQYYYGGFSVFGAHVYIGTLAAIHYHVFFAYVGIRGRRMQRKPRTVHYEHSAPGMANEQSYVMDLGTTAGPTIIDTKPTIDTKPVKN